MVEMYLRHNGDVEELVGYMSLFRRNKTFRKTMVSQTERREHFKQEERIQLLLNVVGSLVR